LYLKGAWFIQAFHSDSISHICSDIELIKSNTIVTIWQKKGG